MEDQMIERKICKTKKEQIQRFVKETATKRAKKKKSGTLR